VICDPTDNVAYELSVSAPADAWEDLWEGKDCSEEGRGSGGGWPSASELGISGMGLKQLLESATLLSDTED
jgi:hypothetical protein